MLTSSLFISLFFIIVCSFLFFYLFTYSYALSAHSTKYTTNDGSLNFCYKNFFAKLNKKNYFCYYFSLFSSCIASNFDKKTVNIIAVSMVQLIFFLSLVFCWVFYNQSFIGFQYEFSMFIMLDFFMFDVVMPVSFGVDALSIFFLLLTGLLGPIVILCSTPLFYSKSDRSFLSFTLLILFIQFFLALSFCVLDFFFFFLAFESVLIPAYLLICIFGINYRKLKASYYFVMYTLVTSITFFIFIFLVYSEVGTANFFAIKYYQFTDGKQALLWFLLFISLAGKVPTFPFYLWLPEAHVEAPTSGSVLLAGLILKLGCYGFLRFLLPFAKLGIYYYLPFIIVLANIGIIFSAFTAIRIIDLKKIVAYSSVAHMNFSLLGLFSNTLFGLHGCSILLLGHGFVSSALFLLIGFLYDRYHTRLLYYYGGFSQVMPLFSIFFLFFNLSNMSFPGSINFVGEFLTLVGVVFFSKLSCFVFLFLSMLSTMYSIWAFSRVCFGEIQFHMGSFVDLTSREFYLLVYLGIFSVLFGFLPNILLDSMYPYLVSLQYSTL